MIENKTHPLTVAAVIRCVSMRNMPKHTPTMSLHDGIFPLSCQSLQSYCKYTATCGEREHYYVKDRN